MLNPSLLRKQLNQIEFFNDFSDDQKAYLAGQEAFFCEFTPGEILIQEGDPENDLYVLIEGSLKVFKNGKEDLAELKPGGVFGEISFFARKRRSTSVRAREAGLVFKLPEEAFLELDCDVQRLMMYKLVELLVGRLEKMNAVMERIQELKKRAKG